MATLWLQLSISIAGYCANTRAVLKLIVRTRTDMYLAMGCFSIYRMHFVFCNKCSVYQYKAKKQYVLYISINTT